MTPLAQEWVDKAEADWLATGQLIRVRKSPNYDLVCYEAQQSAEKYLKARLVEERLSVPRTYNLLHLLGLLLPVEPTWTVLYVPLDALSDYAVVFPYPGQTTNRDEAKDARKHCAIIHAAVRVSLGLPI